VCVQIIVEYRRQKYRCGHPRLCPPAAPAPCTAPFPESYPALAIRRASHSNRSRDSAFRANSEGRILTATMRPRRMSRARYTSRRDNGYFRK
jgi:hypothetical protein